MAQVLFIRHRLPASASETQSFRAIAATARLCQGVSMGTKIAYTDCWLDRAARYRADPAWIEARLHDPGSTFVPGFCDKSLVSETAPPRAVTLTLSERRSMIAVPEACAFLGLASDGSAWFALETGPAAAADLAALKQARFVDLRRVSASLNAADSALLAYARGMMHWHRRHRFCGSCGNPTVSQQGGHALVCGNPSCGARQFPRTDPAIIALVTRQGPGEPTCLLARQSLWPEGLVSTLAGFVEPGESMEEAVVREIEEEVGIRVRHIRYRGSQPWPFPSSLMLAFHAEADAASEIVLDNSELERALWFTRRELGSIRSRGLKLPPRDSIGRMLIEDWWNARDA